jgi:hypothetical protein
VPYTIRDPDHVLDQLQEALAALEHPAFASAPAQSAGAGASAAGGPTAAPALGGAWGSPREAYHRAELAVLEGLRVRFATDAELPPSWRGLRDAAMAAQVAGMGRIYRLSTECCEVLRRA